MDNKTKSDVLKTFVQELHQDKHVLAAFVFGSFARGTSRSDSDIDLLVITTLPFEKKIFLLSGIEFEVFYNNKDDTVKFWEQNHDDFFGFAKDAKLLFGDIETIHFLEQKARSLSQSFSSFPLWSN